MLAAILCTLSKKVATETNSGGYGYAQLGNQRRTQSDIRRERDRFGIPQKASEVIDAVANRQSKQAKGDRLDEQQRLEELSGELKLAGLEYESRYLALLNDERERLIDAEIASRLLSIQDEKDVLFLLAVALTL